MSIVEVYRINLASYISQTVVQRAMQNQANVTYSTPSEALSI